MKNIIATIPKSRFKTWESAEAVVQRCDGENGFWTIRMPQPPKDNLIGSFCYMIYNGVVKGYFDIVDLDIASNFPWHQERQQRGHVLVCANWHSMNGGPEVNGFQGWRYTALRV